MQSKIRKTGLAIQMRKIMIERGHFTAGNLCEDLKNHGYLREQIASTLADFLKRGEICKISDKRILRQKYSYNTNYGPKRGSPEKDKVIKAIYVSGSFVVKDIERLSGQNQNYINKILRRLKARGFVQVTGKRTCAHGRGAELIWRVVDRTRFKIGVIK